MRRIVILPAMTGMFALLFPAVFLLTPPQVQLPLLVVASVSLGTAVGVILSPPRLASVMAASALGIGALIGMAISMEILSGRTLATPEWWRYAVAVILIQGLMHGAVGGACAGGVCLAYMDRRMQGAETRVA